MPFTDRFVKVPIQIHNLKQKELTGKEDNVDSWMKILPFEIASYYPSYGSDNPDEECTQVYLKNGDTVLVSLPAREFEDLINVFVGQ